MVPMRLVTQMPTVTAGLKCPPEMWPSAETMMAIQRGASPRDAANQPHHALPHGVNLRNRLAGGRERVRAPATDYSANALIKVEGPGSGRGANEQSHARGAGAFAMVSLYREISRSRGRRLLAQHAAKFLHYLGSE